jgi:uncharacterized protein (DUF305 family)
MMIVHHQQAVDMGTLAETRASSPEVKSLAAQIKSEQAPEITQMKGWLEAANAPMDMGHDMGMDGMLTDAQMDSDAVIDLLNQEPANKRDSNFLDRVNF